LFMAFKLNSTPTNVAAYQSALALPSDPTVSFLYSSTTRVVRRRRCHSH
jgi:hypothetical protein